MPFSELAGLVRLEAPVAAVYDRRLLEFS